MITAATSCYSDQTVKVHALPVAERLRYIMKHCANTIHDIADA